MSDISINDLQTVPGIPGKIYDLQILSDSSGTPGDEADTSIDIKHMARWAMNYLLRSPRPQFDYQPVFSCCPIGCPPMPDTYDFIVDGDTDSRMDWEFYYMREISGATEGRRIEEAFHKRVRGYLGEHNICWTLPGCFLSDNISPDTKVGSIWATTKLLKSLALSYERTGNEDDKQLACKVFEGLETTASRSGKYAWYPSGFAPVDQNLQPIPLTWEHTAPCPAIESLVCYWEACGDEDALELATACAESLVDNNPALSLTHIEPDGTFIGHTHTTLHAMLGIAHLGMATGNTRYMEFSHRIYEFMAKHGTGTGWVHEGTGPEPYSGNNCSETCTTSDVMSIIASLGQSARFMGEEYSAYWDHLERYFRNHIVPCQFIITPEFEAFYRERHKDKPKEMVEKGLTDLRKVEGGILAGIGINDFVNEVPGDERTSFIMVGCCSPEGMRAIYTVWSNIVSVEMNGDAKSVYVNMSIPTETPQAQVLSSLPDKGKTTVIVREHADFYLRPPAWTPKLDVKAWIGDRQVEAEWDGAYIVFKDTKPGDELTITYPLISYNQQISIFADPNLTATYTWKGSTTQSVDPKGKYFPMHTGRKTILPPGPELPE
ncbi:MAG: glycoside hydrolase family protein [Armatimonadota bacterium]